MSSVKELIEKFKVYTTQLSTTFKHEEKPEKALRIMSFNVQLWSDCDKNNNINKVFDTIEIVNPDIICFQEALLGRCVTLNILQRNLKKAGYLYFELCNNYGINIIASKYEIASSSILRLNSTVKINRYAMCCSFIINNKKIKIVTTHLDLYDETEEVRLKQIKQIIEEYGTDVILVGDFNSLQRSDYSNEYWNDIVNDDKKRDVTSQTKVTDYLDSVGMVDSYTKLNKNLPVISVWSMRRVDYIFMDKNTKYNVINCFIFPSLASDHMPIVADIVI
jgi:endonuclease/exonuclease/phosphatase family metal-dependent hydrolase